MHTSNYNIKFNKFEITSVMDDKMISISILIICTEFYLLRSKLPGELRIIVINTQNQNRNISNLNLFGLVKFNFLNSKIKN